MEPLPATPLPSASLATPGDAAPERFGAGPNGRTPARPEPADRVHQARIARARRELAEPVRIPPEGRVSASTLATLAAAAGVVAMLVGGWAFVTGIGDGGASATSVADYEEAVALLASPDVEQLPLQGSVGRIILAVRPTDEAVLVLNGLGEAEDGWAYQAWISRLGEEEPRPVALFSGREALVPLAKPVPPGATVSVTLEPEAGSFAPTRTAKLFVQRPL